MCRFGRLLVLDIADGNPCTGGFTRISCSGKQKNAQSANEFFHTFYALVSYHPLIWLDRLSLSGTNDTIFRYFLLFPAISH